MKRTLTLVCICLLCTFRLLSQMPCDIECPADTIVNCEIDPTPDNTGMPTVPTECTGFTFFSDMESLDGCNGTGMIIRRWYVAQEGKGGLILLDSCDQVITVQDTTPPVAIYIPPDMTVECSDPELMDILADVPVFQDNCDPDVPALGSIEVVMDMECLQGGLYIQAWAGFDDCLNSTAVGRTVTVVDTSPPVLTDPEGGELPQDLELDCADPVPPPADLVANDNCAVGGGNVIIISEFHYDNTGTDANEFIEVSGTAGLDLTLYSLVLYNGANGLVYGTMVLSGMIDDEAGGFGAVSFAYPVNGIQNGSPDGIALVQGGSEVLEFISYEGSFEAADGPAAGMISSDIGVSQNGDPVGFSLQRTGTGSHPSDFTWVNTNDSPGNLNLQLTLETPTQLFVELTETILPGPCPQEDTIMRHWMAEDDCGNVVTHVQLISFTDDEGPTFTPPGNITINCDENPFDLNVTGNITDLEDNCDMNPSVAIQDQVDLDGCNMTGTITRTFTVTDACGNGTAVIQIITVIDDSPPTFTTPIDVTLDCDDDYTDLTLTGDVTDAMDNCTGVIPNILWINEFHYDNTGTDAGEFIEIAGVAGLDLSNYSLVLYNGNGGALYDVMALSGVIDDESNGFGALAFLYPVNGIQNGSPDGIALVDINDFVMEFISYEGSFIAADGPAAGMMSIDIMVTEDGGTAIGMSLQKTGMGNMPGDFSWTGPVAESPGSLNTGQTIVALPLNEVEVTFMDTEELNDCGVGTVTRAWRAEDDCGNSASGTQIITIMSVPPMSICMDITVELDENGEVSITPDMIDDGSFSICSEVTVTLSDTMFTCADIGDNVVTLTATDECGEMMSCTSTVTVEDNLPPIVDCPQDMTFHLTDGQCERIVHWNITATDNCSVNPQIVQTEGPPSGTAFQVNSTTLIEYVVTDESGNATTCSFTITIVPVAFPLHSLTCNNLVNLSLDANCSGYVGADGILEGGPYKCFNEYMVEVEGYEPAFGGVEINGNSIGRTLGVTITDPQTGISCWGHVYVEDKIPPMLICVDGTASCAASFLPEDLTIDVQTTITNNIQTAIPDNNPAGSCITFDASSIPIAALVSDVTVSVSITHTWVGDLIGTLTAPAGGLATVWDRPGTTGAGFGCAQDNMNVSFYDGAPNTADDFETTCVFNITGDYQPVTPFSGWAGTPASGNWMLCVSDNAGGDIGTINSASLTVAYGTSSVPVATDNCSDVNLTYSDTETGELCEEWTLYRTWTATDAAGNSTTCLQVISIEPISLSDLVCPPTVEVECVENYEIYLDPFYTGYPSFNGLMIPEGGICNIFVGYWDVEHEDCGGGKKIVRQWTILDWCTQETVKCNQIIKVLDLEGPWVECPEVIEVHTDPWFCHTDVDVWVDAEDHCGSDPLRYSLTIDGGVSIPLGGVSHYEIRDLPLGEHYLIWTVEDACGNTSTCQTQVIVVDETEPVAVCDEHTILSLTIDDPLDEGLTKLHAETLDDGSYDNCGDVTFLARRMPPPVPAPYGPSCIDFDWISNSEPYQEYPNNDGGQPEPIDLGYTFQPWVPFACCDVGKTVLVELMVTDEAGNTNTCMVEVEVQDKLRPFVECPPDITVSCDFWFDAHETNGFQPEDGLENVFGRVLDAHDHDDADRNHIIIDDPSSPLDQPHDWGLDGWADDNCDVTITVDTDIEDDCSGQSLPNAPDNAVRLIRRTFRATDGSGNRETCTQRIWVVDFDPFEIYDEICGLWPGGDDVRWPCDLTITDCPSGDLTPDNLVNYAPNNAPLVRDDNCSIIGVTYEDQVFHFVDNACYKIVRTWTVIDWCQFEPNQQGTHYGLWTWVQVIKVHDSTPPSFADCPAGPLTYCVEDANVELPSNNQVFLGEGNPGSSSCSAHVWESLTVHETCSDIVIYDVKLYGRYENPDLFDQIVTKTTVQVDPDNDTATLTWDTRNNSLPASHPIRRNGLEYNDRHCSNWPAPGGVKDYYRVLWTVEDGCGNINTCEYLIRLEDCKKPTPVCVGLSSVVMPSTGEVTIWAQDFDASSFDDCTPHDDLLFSFSGTTYEPGRLFTCDIISANGSPSFLVEIWVADEGNDQNCNGFIQPIGIEWSERNKDFCTTFIIIDNNEGVCDGPGVVEGTIETEESASVAQVTVTLTDPANGQVFGTYTTSQDGIYHFINPLLNGVLKSERDDNHKNGVSTLDLVNIQKHLLGIKPLDSPYKLIAADANNSESVSALDLLEIRKLILGVYTAFPSNESWRFVDAGFEFDDPASPWPFDEVVDVSGMTAGHDFIGVKIGDVNGNVVANASQVQARNTVGVLEFNTDDQHVTAGRSLTVPVYASNFTEILGYQFTLKTKGLLLTHVEAGALDMTEENVGIHSDAITVSWNKVAPVSSTDVLFTLNFTASQSGQLSEMLSVDSHTKLTGAEAYNSNEELLDVTLTFRNGSVAAGKEFALFQNEPNPFETGTMISFTLPEAMYATLTIFDVTGKIVHVIEGYCVQGNNNVTVSRKDLNASGVFYYRLDAGGFTATKKMLISQ